jgi:UDP-2,3-diacylglucosamine hydrolase
MTTLSRPAMATFFISDLHLDPQRPSVIKAFYHFLDMIVVGQQAESLYILGDFFEVWLGDDDDTPVYAEVKAALRRAADAGVSIFIMHGNRDFLLGASFCCTAGVQLIDDPSTIVVDDQPLLLMHGDSLCTRDLDYMQFRQQVRDDKWQQQFIAQPLADRKRYATATRKKSKSLTQRKPSDIMDVTPAAVENVFIKHATTILIHGHTHRPARHQLTIGGKICERIVLGDWDKYGWYLVADRGCLTLRKFLIESLNL